MSRGRGRESGREAQADSLLSATLSPSPNQDSDT